jgi:hypothetical protein
MANSAGNHRERDERSRLSGGGRHEDASVKPPPSSSSHSPSCSPPSISASSSPCSPQPWSAAPSKLPLLNLYTDFITKNAGAVSQIESTLRSLTYIIPGKGKFFQLSKIIIVFFKNGG